MDPTPAQKAARTRKRRTAAAKAARTRKRRAAARRAVETRQKRESATAIKDNEGGRHGTASRAAQQLVASDPNFLVPTAKQKHNLLIAFADKNLVVYGKAFDAVKLSRAVNLGDLGAVKAN